MENSPICAQATNPQKTTLKLKVNLGKSPMTSPRKLVLFNRFARHGPSAPRDTTPTSSDSILIEDQELRRKQLETQSPTPNLRHTGTNKKPVPAKKEVTENLQSLAESTNRGLSTRHEPQTLVSSEMSTHHRLYTNSGLEFALTLPSVSLNQALLADIKALPPAEIAPSTPTSMNVSASQAHHKPKGFGTAEYIPATTDCLAPFHTNSGSDIAPVPDPCLPQLPESIGEYESRPCFLLSSSEILSLLLDLQRNIQTFSKLMPDLMTRGAILDGDWFKVRQDGMRITTDVKEYCIWKMKQRNSSSSMYIETLKLTEEMFSYLQWIGMYRYNIVTQHEIGCVGMALSLLGQLCKAFERKS